MNNTKPGYLPLVLCLLLSVRIGWSQIAVNLDTVPTHLINETFIASECFEVSNITINGVYGQVGTFQEGLNSIGMPAGIVMSTGHINDIPGPNDQPNTGTNMGNPNPDPDIVAISGSGLSVRDPVIIEFDFVPTVDSISFEYVLASEEYCEWSPSNWNDVFGFFLSGPGINGPYTNNAINIAKVPGSDLALSINNVNPFFNSQFYVNNIPSSQSMGCAPMPGVATDLIEFDGFTVPLLAVAEVIPCETYHIKLAIADRSDAFYDSAVFLKAGSFTAGLSAAINSEVIGEGESPTEPYEGCATTSFIFARADTITSNDLVVYYELLPTSTATEGVDFAPLPDSITIPAGQLADTLLVEIYGDNLAEGEETIQLKLRNPCRCSESTISVSIIDPVPLSVGPVPDISLCKGDSVPVTALPQGGVGELSYNWTGFGQDSIQQVFPANSGTYQLIVSDACFQSDTASYQAEVQFPQAELSGSGLLCEGVSETELPITLTDGTDFTLYYSQGGIPTTVTASGLDTVWLTLTQAGTYSLDSVFADGCLGQASGSAEIAFGEIETQVTVDSVSCFGTASGGIDLAPQQGQAPYTFSWMHAATNAGQLPGLPAGNYAVTIVDSQGCRDTLSVEVPQPPPLVLAVDTLIGTADCLQGGTLSAAAAGGSPGYSYAWSNSAAGATVSGLAPGNYAVTVTDVNGCTLTGGGGITSDQDLPVAQVAEPEMLDCQTATVALDATASSQGPEFTYQWIGPSGDTLSPSEPALAMADQAGTYTLVVVNTQTGCETSTTVEVLKINDNLLVELGPPDTLTCLREQLTLQPLAGGPDWAYEWQSADGHFVSSTTGEQVVVNSAGTYFLQVTHADGCTGVDSVIVEAKQTPPTVDLAVTDTLDCAITQAQLSAQAVSQSGQLVLAWSAAEGLSGATDQAQATATAGGWYTLLVTDPVNGCSTRDSIEVIAEGLLIEAPALPDTVINCYHPSMVLDGTSPTPGNFTYHWEDESGTVLGADPQLELDNPGIYQLRISDTATNCTVSTTVEVSEDLVPPSPTALPVLPLTCTRTASSLAIVPGPNHWSPVWQSAEGDTLVTDQWAYTAVTPGEFTLYLTDQNNGCQASLSFNLTADSSAWMGSLAAVDTLNCATSSVPLSVLGPTDAAYSFQWSGGGLSGPTDGPSAAAVDTGLVGLIVTDTLTGCTTSLSGMVFGDFALPSIAGLPADTVLNCNRPFVVLSAQPPGPGNWQYQWSDGQGDNLSNGPSLQVSGGGTYSFRLSNLDNGCEADTSVDVMADFTEPEPQITVPGPLTCIDTSITLTGPQEMPSWRPSWLRAGDTLSVDDWQLPVQAPGTYTLSVIDLANGCAAETTATVTASTTPPQADAGPGGRLDCAGGSFTLEGTASAGGADMSYAWLGPDGTALGATPTPALTVQTTGTFTLVVTNLENGCQATASAPVTEDRLDGAQLALHLPDCQTKTGSLTIAEVDGGSGPYLYALGSEDFSPQNTISDLAPGTYPLRVQDAFGCEWDTLLHFPAPVEVDLTLEEIIELEFGAAVPLRPQVTGGTEPWQLLQWTPATGLSCADCLEPVAGPGQSQAYHFRLVDANGCEAEARVLVNVDQRPSVFIPNAFSPKRSDGRNDHFNLYASAGQVEIIERLTIFDRWGNQLYVGEDLPPNQPSVGWDGRARGVPLNAGVFVYLFELRLTDGRQVTYQGEVILVD